MNETPWQISPENLRWLNQLQRQTITKSIEQQITEHNQLQ